MTFTIKEEVIGDCYIEICQEKFESDYKVRAGRVMDTNTVSITDERIYATIGQAKRRYRDLKRKLR